MAIYHCAAKVISRSQGRSVVAAAAYRAGCNLHDERLGLDHKYARKRGVTHSEIMAPSGAPAWVFEREQLWNQVETAEKRKDSQLARDFDFALPVELTPVERRVLISGFVQEQFVDRGMIADYSIHEDNPQNPHCHLMTTMRTIDAEGFGLKAREWNDKELLQKQRAAWSDHVNQALEQAGHDARVDHRSLQDQGVDDRLPQIHLGVAVTGLLKRAFDKQIVPEHPRVDRFREIQQFNERVMDLDREIAQESARLAAEAAAEAERRLVAARQRLAAEAEAERQRLEAEAAVAEEARLAVEAERVRLAVEAEAERQRLAVEAERQRLEAEAAAAEKARLAAEAAETPPLKTPSNTSLTPSQQQAREFYQDAWLKLEQAYTRSTGQTRATDPQFDVEVLSRALEQWKGDQCIAMLALTTQGQERASQGREAFKAYVQQLFDQLPTVQRQKTVKTSLER